MKVYNGVYEKYAADKIKDAVLDNYQRTGERHTHIKLENADEKSVFLEESKKLDKKFKVEQVASLVYTVSYMGE